MVSEASTAFRGVNMDINRTKTIKNLKLFKIFNLNPPKKSNSNNK
jgi:hypothetical protein